MDTSLMKISEVESKEFYENFYSDVYICISTMYAKNIVADLYISKILFLITNYWVGNITLWSPLILEVQVFDLPLQFKHSHEAHLN